MKKILKTLSIVFFLCFLLLSCSQENILHAAKIMKEMKKYNNSDYSSVIASELKTSLDTKIPSADSGKLIDSENLKNIVELIINTSESSDGDEQLKMLLAEKYKDKPNGAEPALNIVQMMDNIIEASSEDLENTVNELLDTVLDEEVSAYVNAEDISNACSKVQSVMKEIKDLGVFESVEDIVNSSRTRSYKSRGDCIYESIISDIIVATTEPLMESTDTSNYLKQMVNSDAGDRILQNVRALEIVTGTNFNYEQLVKQKI